jgi:DNA-binding CsgD family transcriptional regulator
MKSNPLLQSVLSFRQRECLRLIAEGYTARSIALQLGISIRMVRFHLKAAREKLNALSTSQAVHIAAIQHLLE